MKWFYALLFLPLAARAFTDDGHTVKDTQLMSQTIMASKCKSEILGDEWVKAATMIQGLKPTALIYKLESTSKSGIGPVDFTQVYSFELRFGDEKNPEQFSKTFSKCHSETETW